MSKQEPMKTLVDQLKTELEKNVDKIGIEQVYIRQYALSIQRVKTFIFVMLAFNV